MRVTLQVELHRHLDHEVILRSPLIMETNGNVYRMIKGIKTTVGTWKVTPCPA